MAMRFRYLTHPRRAWREDWFEVRLGEAQRRLRTGDYASAARGLDCLCSERRGDAALRAELSTARRLMVQERVDQLWSEGEELAAVALVETAAVAFPDEPEFPLWLGPAAVVQHRFDVAAEHAARAVRLAPATTTVLFRAASFGRWGDNAAARRYLETIKDLLARDDDGADFVLLGDLPRLEAQILWGERRFDEALVFFRYAASVNPDDQYAAADLAQALINVGNRDEALTILDDALVAYPDEQRLIELRQRAVGN